MVSSLSPPSTQAHWEQETSIASLFFPIKPTENEELHLPAAARRGLAPEGLLAGGDTAQTVLDFLLLLFMHSLGFWGSVSLPCKLERDGVSASPGSSLLWEFP